MKSSGNRIKDMRETNGLSQKELANALGYKTYTTISKWEADASLPPSNELKKLATFFDISTDYLLGLENKPSPQFIDNPSDTIELEYFETIHPEYLHIDKPKSDRKIKVPRHVIEKSPSAYFVAKVQTDSINRIIPNGENAVILDYRGIKNPVFQTGDIIVAKTNNEYRVSYLRKTDSIYYLEAMSFIEGYEDTEYTKEEFEKLEIIGKIVYTFNHFN